MGESCSPTKDACSSHEVGSSTLSRRSAVVTNSVEVVVVPSSCCTVVVSIEVLRMLELDGNVVTVCAVLGAIFQISKVLQCGNLTTAKHTTLSPPALPVLHSEFLKLRIEIESLLFL